jgi:hypothetical protein
VNVRNVIEMTTYREVILHLIEVNQGLKLTDLTLKVMSETNPQNFKGDIYHLELTKLILEREIVEISYILKKDFKLIRMYFPKGTRFVVPSEAHVDGSIIDN